MENMAKITEKIMNTICSFDTGSPQTHPEYESFSRKVWNTIDKYMSSNKIKITDSHEFAQLVNKDIGEEFMRNFGRADANIISRRAINYLGKEVRIQKIAEKLVSDKLPGGKSDNKTPEDIAKKRQLPPPEGGGLW